MRDSAIRAAINFLTDKLSQAEKNVSLTTHKVVNAPGAMESWSDKSKDEFSQLASALLKEAEPIRATIKELQQFQLSKSDSVIVSAGSFVVVDRDGWSENYLLVSGYGGDVVFLENDISFYLLSLRSDLGKKLSTKKVKDEFAHKENKIKITKICNS